MVYSNKLTPKNALNQPQPKGGAKISIFSGNPATDSSKQAVYCNKAASSSEVKLLDLISWHQIYIGPDHNFSQGLILITQPPIQKLES